MKDHLLSPISIYPLGLAQRKLGQAGAAYRPNSEDERQAFYDAWCRTCARDRAMATGRPSCECDEAQCCQIIAASENYDLSHPDYPKVWVYSSSGQPLCSAYLMREIPKIDTLTLDLFHESAA